jgi:hypothetical protein
MSITEAIDIDLESAYEFLSTAGVPVGPDGSFDLEAALLAVRRQRGWEPEIRPEGEHWRVSLTESEGPSQHRVAVVRDDDPARGLLRAIRVALTWLTREEEEHLFDKLARSLVGYGAEEFYFRLNHNQLDLDDPVVTHLLISRPFGRG